MSTPYFSVLVAAYNVDKYLDECLTSLIQQTYLDAEFIVVDDASTDNLEFPPKCCYYTFERIFIGSSLGGLMPRSL